MEFGQLKRRDLVSLLVGSGGLSARRRRAAAAGASDPARIVVGSCICETVAAVNEKLKDPQSVRYGDMVRKLGPNLNGKPAEVVCGSIIAKDAVGASGAKRPFVYFIADGAVFLVDAKPSPEDVAQIIYGRFCK